MGVIVGLILPLKVGAEAVCKDVQFMFARGSGSIYGDSSEWRSLKSEISKQMDGLRASYGVYEVNYPAVEVNFWNAAVILITAGNAFEFNLSVTLGVMDVTRFYNEQTAKCEQTKFVLVGYSQGARVIARALDSLDAQRVLYVATLGDPDLYLPEGVGLNPPACRGERLSAYRIYAPNCNTKNGILGARDPYEVSGYTGKFGLWCSDDDLICGGSRNLFVNSGHTKYGGDGHIGSAVREAVLRIRKEILGQNVVIKTGSQTAMDTAILIDSTGSMASYIAKYKAEAMRLARLTLSSGGRVALYEYRDLNDPFDLNQLCDFSCSLLEFEQKLNAIRTAGGGDEPESLLSAALGVLNSLKWKKGATKSIIALTDATYHAPDLDGTTIAQVAKRSLEIDPVNIYVVTEEYNREAYDELTRLTGGKVFGIGEMGMATDYIVSRPVAILPFEKYYGGTGELFYFDASASYGVGSEIVRFEWDLDGDGVFELETSESFISTKFWVEGERFVVVKAVAEDGGFSTMSALVIVEDNKTENINRLELEGLKVEKASSDEAIISWESTDNVVYVLAAVNDVPLGYVLSEAGEVRINGLDFNHEIKFTLTGMDAEFNLGESSEVLLLVEKSVKQPISVKDVMEDDLELTKMADAQSPITKASTDLNLMLPSTGSALANPVQSSLWALGLSLTGIGVVIYLLKRKRRASNGLSGGKR